MKFMVAFSTPKRSAATVETAATYAKALGAELYIVRIIPDPEKVGVIAQLIATERPQQKAQQQVDATVEHLRSLGLTATGMVKVGEVAPGIISTASELGVDLVFIGTTNIERQPFFLMENNPIVHYVMDRCPISVLLVRRNLGSKSEDNDD
jgi:nucleotide-binding universal stress UspA family protein